MVFLIALAQALKTATPNRTVVGGEFRKNKRPGQEGFVLEKEELRTFIKQFTTHSKRG